MQIMEYVLLIMFIVFKLKNTWGQSYWETHKKGL